MEYAVAVFSCTHDAIGAQKYLQKYLSVQMMPTPRAISASCGISLRFDRPDTDQVRALLNELNIKFSLYQIDAQGIPSSVQKI